ncbi:hypothetical protein ACFWMR_03815 [Amycolatopsis thailandensis]|uniref:hypothetical protein n=1 Tax=Amycolatopsis thailandensis TaxID=589330 RepID=UPI00365CE596
MTAPDIRREIESALSHKNSADIVEGVKSAVIREFKSIDPSAEVASTEYFNHSYVPDLVVQWRENGKNLERNVYLRYTLRSAALGGDVASLGSLGPIVLALRDEDEGSIGRDRVLSEIDDESRILVTNVPALDTVSALDAAAARPPLVELLKGSIVKGGRGLIDHSTMQDLTSGAESFATSGEDSADSEAQFRQLIEQSFLPDAALRLSRAALILQAGASDDPESLLFDDDGRELIGGKLSRSEIRVLLPYLLSRTGSPASSRFWSYIGSIVPLADLEEIYLDLEGLDLSPLVIPNLQTWVAAKADAVQVSDEEDLEPGSESESSASAVTQPAWRIHAKMLCVDLDSWRIHVEARGRKIRGRSDSASALWDDLSGQLAGFGLAHVSLRGASRAVDVSAESDSDVRSDIEKISETLEDRFYVPRVGVMEYDRGDGRVIDIDFQKMVAFGQKKSTLGSLARAAARILTYRNPIDPELIARYLG